MLRRLAALSALALAPIALAAQEHQHNPAHHAPGAPDPHAPTVVIIVRHGEKAPAPANDPQLSAVGQERAAALAEMLKDAKIDVVMHTPTTRTRETARPTAERFGLTMEVLPMGPMASHAAAVAEAVKKHQGKTILVVGHSNTIMSYIGALGGPARGELCDHQYDGIYTVVIGESSVRLIEGRYGPANPPVTVACGGMVPASSRP